MKTKDGIKLEKIIRVAMKAGAIKRNGANHRYILNYPELRPCPVAPSTNARTMIVPWIQEITNYNSKTIYTALRKGKW